MMGKAEILADESRFQQACSAYVNRNVLYCVSSLMYSIGQNVYDAAEMFDEDSDEMLGWFVREDWEQPVLDYIDDADLSDLEDIAEKVGYWSDVVSGLPEPFEHEYTLDGEPVTVWKSTCLGDKEFDDEDEVIEAIRNEHIGDIRERVKALITNDDEYREIADYFSLDPEQHEVYEHWIVDRYFSKELEAHGELVFNFCDMLIWGRCTTGQSISLDGVIRRIVADLSEEHWIWREA